jgi:hypothetical protein
MNKRTLLFITLTVFVLAGCGTDMKKTTIDEQNKNPLTASRYGDELADAMANLVIQNDPLAKDPNTRAIIDRQIERGKQIGQDARSLMAQGMYGPIIAIKEPVTGNVVYLNDVLYLSPDFYTKPGTALRVYLTTMVDPRDVKFPDNTALDLGPLQAAYGQQQYPVPSQKNPALYRTFVLWDTVLNRLYGFSQLSKQG